MYRSIIITDNHHIAGGQPSTTKIERKVLEKNRRNLMKDLCFKLNSLLPNFNPREPLRRGEQIDEAIRYIKSLETSVKMGKEKKESLLLLIGRKRCRGGDGSSSSAGGFDDTSKQSPIMPPMMTMKPPTMEVHEMGSLLQVVLTCGINSHFIFNEIIRILHEHNIDVVAATSSLSGDLMLHVVHAEIRQFHQLGATNVSEKLKKFVNGHLQDFQGT